MDHSNQLNGDGSQQNHELILQSRPGQILNARPYLDRSDAPNETTDDFAVLVQYAQLLWRCKWILVSTSIVGVFFAAGLTLQMTPLYRAKTSMQIEDAQEPFGANPLAARESGLVTQMQLLSSASMRERVLSKLKGKTDIPNPKVYGALVSLRKLLGMTGPAAIPWNEAISIAAGSASTRSTKDSHIVEIESQSTIPHAAAAFTDTLAEEYIKRIQEERWDSYQHTGEWLTRAQEELKTKVEESDARVANFAKSKRLVYTGAQNVAEDKLKQLQTQLLTASAERIGKQSVWESSQNSPTESLPSVLDSGPMATYQTKLADLRRELAELSATLTPSHYRTQRVQAQIDELEKERSRERANIISRIRIEYESALKRENELRRVYDEQTQALAGQADDVIHYNILQREAETNKKLYEMALQQGKQASIASALRTSNARIVDRAITPKVPTTPNLLLNLSIGIFGGLVLGGLFVIVRSRMNAKIQSPGVLELHMNLRELGVIPAAVNDSGMRVLSRLQRSGDGGADHRRTKLDGADDPSDCVELITWNRKPSVIAEAFRATMTSILFSAENGPNVFVITSATPQEGKSTVVTNLAIALAEINHRVLLIDADMRLPRLHSIFDLPNTLGLSDLLHEPKPLHEYVIESVVRKTHIPHLAVLTAGPARMNLSRLLHSTRMKDLVTRFREVFDVILIDTAPVLSVPDSRIVARVADGVILVVRAHKTHQEAAFAAVKRLAEDGHSILGTILNDWNPKMSMYGQYSTYSQYYSHYSNLDTR